MSEDKSKAFADFIFGGTNQNPNTQALAQQKAMREDLEKAKFIFKDDKKPRRSRGSRSFSSSPRRTGPLRARIRSRISFSAPTNT